MDIQSEEFASWLGHYQRFLKHYGQIRSYDQKTIDQLEKSKFQNWSFIIIFLNAGLDLLLEYLVPDTWIAKYGVISLLSAGLFIFVAYIIYTNRKENRGMKRVDRYTIKFEQQQVVTQTAIADLMKVIAKLPLEKMELVGNTIYGSDYEIFGGKKSKDSNKVIIVITSKKKRSKERKEEIKEIFSFLNLYSRMDLSTIDEELPEGFGSRTNYIIHKTLTNLNSEINEDIKQEYTIPVQVKSRKIMIGEEKGLISLYSFLIIIFFGLYLSVVWIFGYIANDKLIDPAAFIGPIVAFIPLCVVYLSDAGRIPFFRDRIEIHLRPEKNIQQSVHYLYYFLKKNLSRYYNIEYLYRSNHKGTGSLYFKWPGIYWSPGYAVSFFGGKLSLPYKLTIMGSKKEIQEIREYLSILLSEPIKIPTSEKIEQIPAPEASNRKKDLLEKMKDEDKKAIAKAAASFSTWKNSAFFVVLMILVMLLMMYPMFTGPNYEALDNYIVYDEQFSGNQASSVELDGMQRIKIRILVDEFDKETNSLQVRFIDAENDINQNYRYFSSRHNYIDSDDDQTLYTKTNATIDIRGDVNVRIIIYGRLVFPTGLVSPFLFYGIVVGLAAFMLVFSTRNPYNNSDQHPYLDKLINEKFAENDLPISSFGINILVSTLVLFGILLSIYCILDSTNAAMLEQFLSNTDIINSSSVWLFIASSAFAAYDIASKKSESFSMLRGIIYIFVLTLIFQIIILGTHFITWIRYFTV